jgi:hypothetical protein
MKTTDKNPKEHPLASSISWEHRKFYFINKDKFAQRIDETNGFRF